MTSTVPNLEERFFEPPGWRWHHVTRNGRKMRFGTVAPKDSIPDAVVVCLPGLSEYAEKYFETARTCLSMNLSFWVIDWMGQGKSDRYLKNKHKRHSRGFDQDVDDLHQFVLGYIKHSAVHPDRGRIPLVMLAHSMGANIGLRYLAKHPGMFECAALTSPMVGIRAMEKIPLKTTVAGALNMLLGKSYVAGGREWREDMRPATGESIFSTDPVRASVHNAWLAINPDLQVGGVTYGWIYEAAKSCAVLQKPDFAKSIQTHCLIGLAGKDKLVSNNQIRKLAAGLPHAKLMEFADGQHELIMEQDEIRKIFFNALHAMIKDRIISRPETLKPF